MSKNPWLNIPLNEYETHMASDKVKQTQMINDVFAARLTKYNPQDIFVAGCTSGNGFEYINWGLVNSVTANDINPEFLNVIPKRYEIPSDKLNLLPGNIEQVALPAKKYDFVFAALLFEYIDVMHVLQKLRGSMTQDGVLVALVQQPHESMSAVSTTPYTSLMALSGIMKLYNKDDFIKLTISAGFVKTGEEYIVLDSGKKFYIGEFGKGIE